MCAVSKKSSPCVQLCYPDLRYFVRSERGGFWGWGFNLIGKKNDNIKIFGETFYKTSDISREVINHNHIYTQYQYSSMQKLQTLHVSTRIEHKQRGNWPIVKCQKTQTKMSSISSRWEQKCSRGQSFTDSHNSTTLSFNYVA